MQPQNPLNRVPGSFAKPPEPARKAQPQPQPSAHPQPPVTHAVQTAADVPSLPQEEMDEKTAEQKKEQDREAALADIRQRLEKSLEATITEEDLEKYIFQGSFSKEVTIVRTAKTVLRGTFRTHTPADTMQVDEKYAEFQSKNKNTPEGLANEKAMINLSYCWTHANGKPIGKSSDDRLSRMRNMGAFMVENAGRANGDFQLLLKICLEEGGLIKK